MGESSGYRGYTEAQARAHKRYISKFAEIKIRVETEHRDAIQAHAQARGESVNGFIKRAIQETMERENQHAEGQRAGE